MSQSMRRKNIGFEYLNISRVGKIHLFFQKAVSFSAVSMAGLLVTPINFVFKAICFSFASYLILLQIGNYLRNEDVSTITFKRLNSSPRDQYPTFTLCFVDKEIMSGLTYNSQNLIGTNSGEDQNSLWEENDVDGTILTEKFDHASIKAKDLVQEFSTQTTAGTKVDEWPMEHGVLNGVNDDVETSATFPLYISYQDLQQVCYTRKYDDDLEVMRKSDVLQVDLKKMKSQMGPAGILRIYVHNPGQFIRGIGKELAQYEISHLGVETFSNQITVTISQIVVLNKRSDAQIPCNPELIDEDSHIIETVVKDVGCVPAYWKPLMKKPDESNLTECTTSSQMKTAQDVITTNTQNALDLFDESCKEMTIVAGTESNFKNVTQEILILKLHYLNEMFLEITNGERFSAQGFLCRIGGFLGMFLGFSLLQIPDIITALLTLSAKKIKESRQKNEQKFVPL